MTRSSLTYVPGFSGNSSHLEYRAGLSDTFWKGPTQGPFLPGLV
jgi:hypothetical protein